MGFSTLSLAWPAIAAEPAGEGGLPQFDVSFFPGQLFWLAISFILLYVLMAFVALPRVKVTQDRRYKILATELAAAADANNKAKTIIAQYEKALTDARRKAHVTVEDMMAVAAKASSERQVSQHSELHTRLRDAEKKIAEARDTALQTIPAAASDMAETIIHKLTGSKMQVQA